MPDNQCGNFKKASLKLTGILAGFGFNVMTEKLGLGPIPLSNGDSLDINPGYVLKQEINGICAEGRSQSIFPVDFRKLSLTGQGLLLDRLTEMSGKASDLPLNIPGKRFEAGTSLSFIDLPGEASVIVWYNPKVELSNPKITDLNAVMVKWKVNF